MLVVGELINSSRKEIKEFIENKDLDSIIELAKKQAEAGATYLDVNCGTQVYEEEETMRWLVKNIVGVTDLPLCIDTPSDKALAVGLEMAAENGKQQMINSITAESQRYNAIIPLVKEYKTKLIALCMDSTAFKKSIPN